jgi:hypothetical protein
MTDASTSSALAIALAYHQAWTSHNLDQTMTYIADDITCDAPGPAARRWLSSDGT